MVYVLEKEKNTSEIRQDFIKIAISQDDEVEQMNVNLQDDLSKLVRTYTKNNTIQDKDAIDAKLPSLFSNWEDVFIGLILQHNTDVVEVLKEGSLKALEKEGADFRFLGQVERRADVFLDNMDQHILNRVVPQNKYTVGERIKTITGSNLATVRNILEVGIKNGVSAEQIAKQIDLIIKPPKGVAVQSPFDFYRERFGYDASKKVTTVQPGSASYQSKRIARTEINNTYRYDMVNMHQGSKFVLGFMWNLSLAHPQYDICDFYHRKIFQTVAQIPLTHPNCICFTTVVLRSGGEF